MADVTFYAIGSELNAVYDYYGQYPPTDTTNQAGNPNARGAVSNDSGQAVEWNKIPFVGADGNYLNSSTGLTTFWMAVDAIINANSPGIVIMEWHDDTNTARLRMITSGSFTFKMQWLNSGTWTDVPGTWSINYQQALRFDFYFNLTSSGIIQIFSSNVLVAGSTGPTDFSSLPKITHVLIYALGPIQYGSWMVADGSTRENVVYFKGITGNGATQQWTGDYTAIDEFPESTADVIFTNAAGETSSFTHPAFSTLQTGYEVKALAVSVLCRNDTDGGPQNLELGVNIGGTVYNKPVPEPGVNYAGRAAIWSKDPSTDAPWNGITNVNGEKSFTSVA